MIPIGVFCVVALTVFLERWYSLRAEKVIPKRLYGRVKERVLAAQWEEAEKECLLEENDSPTSQIMLAGIRRQGRPRGEIKEALEEAGRRHVADLSRVVELLGTIAAITPLIGLLGTVVGMIDVFRTVVSEVGATAGAVNPASLANGIWAALLTTAAGLSVAIPAYLGYRSHLGRVDRLSMELEEISLQLLDDMTVDIVPKSESDMS